jgi:hypothetical protein
MMRESPDDSHRDRRDGDAREWRSSMAGHQAPVRFEGLHCAMTLTRPAPGVVVLAITGHDVGELGDEPFRALEADLAAGRLIALFIDGRNTQGASVSVSSEWALWLRKHRDGFAQVTMLTASRFIEITASFVRRFSELEDLMRVTTDPAAFDEAVAAAVGVPAPGAAG